MIIPNEFPSTRLRRLRRTDGLRRLVQESTLSVSDLIYPVFVQDGENRTDPVESMPGVFRHTIDSILKEAEKCVAKKIPAVAIFPVIGPALKTENAIEAFNPNGLIPDRKSVV